MRNILILLLFVLTLKVSGQNNKNALLEKNLTMSYLVPLEKNLWAELDSNNRFFMFAQNYFEISNDSSVNFQKLLCTKLPKKNFNVYYERPTNNEAYYYFPYNLLQTDTMPKQQAIENLKAETSEENNTSILDTTSLKGIMFYENWIFNEKKFSFRKQITAYSPVRKYYSAFDENKRFPKFKKIFVIRNNRSNCFGRFFSKLRSQPLCTVKYEFFLGNEYAAKYYKDNQIYYDCELNMRLEKDDCPFWTSYSRRKIVEIITNHAVTGKAQAFDFHTGEKLDTNIVKQRLGSGLSIIDKIDINGNVVTETYETSYDISEIESVIFYETWFIDPKTLQIKKQVNAIAPVRYCYKEDDIKHENPVKKIAFLINLNQ